MMPLPTAPARAHARPRPPLSLSSGRPPRTLSREWILLFTFGPFGETVKSHSCLVFAALII
jgi:hypothetical protein